MFLKVLLNRISDWVEEKQKNHSMVFDPTKVGTDDAIFLVRQIIVKVKENKIALHFNFIDFKAVF